MHSINGGLVSALPRPIQSRLLTALLVSSALLQPCVLKAEQVPVRYMEGTVHGFLVLRTEQGGELAAGDLVQVVRGDRLESELIFHFKDGSVDDEVTVFSQQGMFRLLSDHHVQKGPAFPHPMDVSINASSGEIQIRSTEKGKEKNQTKHLHLPPDLGNGMLLTILKNIRPDSPETKLSYLVATPKPRLVKLTITPYGEDTFTIAGSPHRATHYVIKVELGGVAGVIAPLIGKQPKDMHVWILGGKAPAFVKMEGPLYEGGPIWRIELTSPVWQQSQHSERHRECELNQWQKDEATTEWHLSALRLCRSSAQGWRKRCTWASMSPGIRVASPRFIITAPLG